MRPLRHAATGAACVGVAILTSACFGSGRSVDAYCSTFWGEGAKVRSEFTFDQKDPLASLIKLLAAPQELATFFKRLDDVAPDDIEPDVAVVASTFQKQADSLGDTAKDPLGGTMSSLLSSLSAGPSFNRVDAYTAQQCGAPPKS